MARGAPRRGRLATGSLFPPFAGVALADILANSAAIVIIMIVVTLVARREEEEQKLEQSDDVAVLLSRELATSFVMNALPTSVPARLHDYVTYPPDRNPQHAEMPIVELHAGYVRDYYTGRIYTRDELLRQDNAFDAYLGRLAFEQLQAVRIDVYSITEFYIAMSILKAHGVQPRHWHFLTEGANRVARDPGEVGVPEEVGILAERLRRDRPEFEPSDGWPGLGSSIGRSESNDDRPGSSLPDDVDLAVVGGGTEAYPLDSLGLGSVSGARTGGVEESLDLPPNAAGRDSAQGSPAGPGVPGGEADGTSAVRFRTAQLVSVEGTAELDFDLHTVLRGLFAFMRSVQADADAGRPSPLADFDFGRDVLARAEDSLSDEDEGLVGALAQALSEPAEEENPNLVVVHRRSDRRGQALGVPVNRPLYLAHWLRGPDQREANGEVETDVTLRLGLHAAVYRGLRAPLVRDGYILMPPVAGPDREPRWRVVTLVSAKVDDFVTGFVYAGVDDDGRLRLPVDENAVEIGGVGAESVYPPVALRGERRQLVFYGLIAALFAVGVVIRVWRRA